MPIGHVVSADSQWNVITTSFGASRPHNTAGCESLLTTSTISKDGGTTTIAQPQSQPQPQNSRERHSNSCTNRRDQCCLLRRVKPPRPPANPAAHSRGRRRRQSRQTHRLRRAAPPVLSPKPRQYSHATPTLPPIPHHPAALSSLNIRRFVMRRTSPHIQHNQRTSFMHRETTRTSETAYP